MSSLLPDLVKIQVLSSGTGPFQLGAAATGFRGIEALIDGGNYSYSVQSGAQFEIGTCVWNAGSGLLIRTPLVSSNGNAAVAFGANVEVKFVALGQDLTPPGALPIVQTTGTGLDVAMSQKATTDNLISLQTEINAFSANTGANLVGFKQAGSGAVDRTVGAEMALRVNVKQFGAAGDGTTDDTLFIRAAVAYLKSAGGGVLWFPRGSYKITDTIFVTGNHIVLMGEGGTVDGNVAYVGGMTAAISSAASRILWAGVSGGIAVSFRPLVDDGSLPPIIGGGLSDIMIDGASLAGFGLEILTVRYGVFRNSSIMRCTNVNTQVGTTVNNVVGGNKSTAFCHFENFTSSNATLGGTAKTMVCYGHITDGNVAINQWTNCGFYNGTGSGSHIEMENCDSNTLVHCRWNGSLTFHATGTGTASTGDSVARHNVLLNPQGHVIAKAKTGTPHIQGTNGYDSYGNMAFGYSVENGIAYPTVEAWADFQYHVTGLGLTNSQGGFHLGYAPNITLMAKTADQSIPSGVTTLVGWDAVSFDWMGAGDATGDKITAPNGVKWARFSFAAEWASDSTAGRFISIRRNGTDFISKSQVTGYINSQDVVMTQWFAVTPGDYFQVMVNQNTAGALNLLGTPGTFIQAEWN